MKLLKGVGDFFALDIGTNAIRVVQLSGSDKSGWNLQNYGYGTVDPSIVQSSSEDSKKKLGEVISTVINQSGIKTRNVAISMPSNKSYTAIIDVPNQPEAELKKVIKYQLDQYVPMAVDDAKVDWAILGVSTKDSTKQEVLIASTAIAYSEERMEMIEDLGLNVVAIEPDPIAIARSLTPSGSQDARLLIDLGETSADVIMMYMGAPRLVRSIPGGLQALVKASAQSLNVKEDQARQFILKFGLAQDKLEGQVFKALDTNLDVFASELIKSIKFFQTKYPNTPVGGIALSGFAGIIPLISEYIEAKTSTPTSPGNPWQRINVPQNMQEQLSAVGSEFTVAIGLAERSNDD